MLKYGESGNNNIGTTICCDKGNDDYDDSYISLENKVATDDDEKTETSDEVPAYLSTYEAPSELGDDKLSGNVEIGGDVYTLPAPASAFTNNGWKIASNEDVAAGDTGNLKISKDDKELEVTVTNMADYQTKASNCAVTRISVWLWGNDDEPEVNMTLPGGLTIGTSSADLKTWAGDKFDYSKSDDREYYDYSEYKKRDFYISIDCEGTVDEISISNSTWPSE